MNLENDPLQNGTSHPPENRGGPSPLKGRPLFGNKNSFQRNQNLQDILLITDKYWISQTIAPLLECNYNFFFASLVPDGLEFIQTQTPDLILCDSEQNVENVVTAISHSQSRETPFLLICSALDRKKYLSLLGKGITDFLITPFTIEEFQNKVRHFLDFHQTRKILQKLLENSQTSLIHLAEGISLECQKLKRLNKIKHDFLSVLSHELRNPISVISGFSEVLLADYNLPEDAQKAASAIFRNAQIQAKLVTDLFDVARGFNSKLVLECKPVEFKPILLEVLASIEASAHKKNIRVEITCDNGPNCIHGDPVRLTQVIWNLFSNAVKFTPPNGRIAIELLSLEKQVQLRITDSGVGIDPESLPYIFDEFHQQDSSITKNFGGLGLGLAIVRNIVELHGGKVQAHSDGPGRGATFQVQLPLLHVPLISSQK